MIYFKDLGPAYVQTGTVQLEKTYVEGFVNGQLTPLNAPTQPFTELPYPEYFSNTWATLMTPTDATGIGYDRGAYGAGVSVYNVEYTNLPKFKKVRLLTRHDTGPTYTSHELVEWTGTDGDLAPYLNRVFSEQEFIEQVNPQGLERGNGSVATVYPVGMSRSNVNNLSSLKGDLLETVDGAPFDAGVVIHVEPMYLRNRLPMFDIVYLQTDNFGQDAANNDQNPNLTQVSYRVLRWRGEFTSENRAFMGFTDHSGGNHGVQQGQTHDPTLGVVDRPVVPQQLVIDGVTYLNADMYNVTRKL